MSLFQRSSTWGIRTSRGTKRHLREYVKSSYGVCKIKKKKKKILRDKHGIIMARLMVSKRRPGCKTFDLGAPVLSLSLSLSHDFALVKYLCSLLNFYMKLLVNILFLM
jgi:hypothetical protein